MSQTGAPPAATLGGIAAAYRDGDTVTATVAVTDPDTRTDTVTGVNADGVPTTVTTVSRDTAQITAAWFDDGEPVEWTGLTVTAIARHGCGALHVTVVDAEGNTATAVSDPLQVSQPTLIGFDVAPIGKESVAAAFTRVAKLVPGAAYIAVYCPPGTGLANAAWGGKTLAAIPDGAVVGVSFKDTPTPELLNPWLDTIPDKVARVCLTAHHEDDTGDATDVPVDVYKADWAALRAIVDAHPNGHKVQLWEVLTQYAERHGKGPVTKWWTGHAHGLAEDCYNADPNAYPAPPAFLDDLIAAAAALGVPWAMREWGSKLVAGDTDGTKRAAWIKAVVAYARKKGCVYMGWWFTGGEDLTADPAGLAALQQAIRG